MSLIFTKKENQESKITITISETEYKQTVEKKIKEYTKKINIKGYRPGKVPISLVNQLYRNDFINQELKQISKNQLDEWIKTTELCLIGSLINTDIKQTENNNLIIEYSIDVIPTFNTDIPSNLHFFNYIVEDIPDTLINDQITMLYLTKGKCKESKFVSENSFLYVSFSHETNFYTQAILLFPKLNEKTKKSLLEKTKGDIIIFDLKDLLENQPDTISFKDSKIPYANEIPSKVNLTIIEIKEIENLNLNKDDIAKTLNIENVDSEKKLKSFIKSKMFDNINFFKSNLLRYEIVNKIIENLNFQLPQYIVQKYITDNLETNDDAKKNRLIDIKIKSIKWNLFCSELVRKQKLSLPTEPMESMIQYYANEVLSIYSSKVGKKLNSQEKEKILIDNTEYIRSKALNHIREEFVINLIKTQVTITDKKISYPNLEKLIHRYSPLEEKEIV